MKKVSILVLASLPLCSSLFAMLGEHTFKGLFPGAPGDIKTLFETESHNHIRSDLINLLTRQPITELVDKDADEYVYQMAFDPSGRYCVAVRKDIDDYHVEKIDIYSLPDFVLERTIEMATSFVRFSPRGKFLSVYKKSKGKITLIDMKDVSTREFIIPSSGYNFDEEEKLLFSVQESKAGNSVGIWDIDSGEETFEFPLPDRISYIVPHQNLIIISTDDNRNRGHMEKITLLGIKDNRLVETAIEIVGKEIHHGHCNFALHLDKGLLALSSYSDIFVWNLSSKKLLKQFEHDDQVNGIAFNKQGTLLASASDDWTAGLWHLGNNDPNKATYVAIEGSRHIVQKVAFYPQENIFCSGHDDLYFWDISKTKPTQICAVSGYGVENMIMSPGGQFFATDGSGSVWCFPMPGQFTFIQLWWLKAASLAQKKLIGPALAVYLYADIDRVFSEHTELFQDHLRKIMQEIILSKKCQDQGSEAHREFGRCL